MRATTGVDITLSKLYEAKIALELYYLKEGDKRLKEASELMSLPLEDIMRGYSALYYSPRIKINIESDISPLLYIKNIYKMIEESRGLFKDAWIGDKLSEIQTILINLLYDISKR